MDAGTVTQTTDWSILVGGTIPVTAIRATVAVGGRELKHMSHHSLVNTAPGQFLTLHPRPSAGSTGASVSDVSLETKLHPARLPLASDCSARPICRTVICTGYLACPACLAKF